MHSLYRNNKTKIIKIHTVWKIKLKLGQNGHGKLNIEKVLEMFNQSQILN